MNAKTQEAAFQALKAQNVDGAFNDPSCSIQCAMYPSARQQLLPKAAPVSNNQFKGGSQAVVAQKGSAILQQ